MLPTEFRLRRGEDFRAAVRKGRRTARGPLVVFIRSRSRAADVDAMTPPTTLTEFQSAADVLPVLTPGGEPRFGLVVSRAVGNSVIRHRVSRRLRTQLYQRRDLFPAGHDVVVRALPAAARATSAELGASLDAVVRRVGSSSRPTDRARRG